MKKTTIRIAGFLLAAACVALLASCNQANKPTTTTTTPGGNGGGSSTPAALTKAALKNSLWKIKDSTFGEKVYLFHFDNADAADLRLAYGDKLEAAQIKTRKATVDCKIADGKITIDDLKIKDVPIAKQGDDKLILTLSDTQIITLAKVTAPAGVDFKKAADNNDDVVEKFNMLPLFNVMDFGGVAEKDKAWQVKKIEGTDVSAKKLYIIFTANDKVTLAVDSTTNAKTKANAESVYAHGIKKFLGYPSLTISDMGITDAKIVVTGAPSTRKAKLTLADNKVWELDESNVAISYFTTDKPLNDIKALFVK